MEPRARFHVDLAAEGRVHLQQVHRQHPNGLGAARGLCGAGVQDGLGWMAQEEREAPRQLDVEVAGMPRPIVREVALSLAALLALAFGFAKALATPVRTLLEELLH